ncbi:MAG: FAD-dependent oxidoreductase, partial [Actinomycetota bacterium]|nr:FAD-dependent oxidoreductase [Actinomycetota bacterium]
MSTRWLSGQEAVTKTYGLRGGNDQLPRAFAAALAPRIIYRARVLRIDSRSDEVIIGYRDPSGTEQRIAADFGVCTIPFPILKKLDLAGLTEQKMQAIEQYQLFSAARVYFQTRTAFWGNDSLGALGGPKMIGTDTLAERVWNTSPGQPGPEGMLHAYLLGDNAHALESVPHQARAD